MAHASYYKDMLIRAVHGDDDELLNSLSAHLADCEEAKTVLRMRGHGLTGKPFALMARMVPMNDAQGEKLSDAAAKVALQSYQDIRRRSLG